jgi:hypothetical protein
MPNIRYVQYGPRIPYPRPVIVPSSGIFDEPKHSICINDEWIPYVVGASKVLLNDETWDETDQSILLDTESQVSDALSSWTDCATVTGLPDWHYHWSFQGDAITLFQFLPEEDSPVAVNSTMRSFEIGIRNVDPENTSVGITIHFHDNNHAAAGLHIDEIYIITWGALGVMSYLGTTCLNDTFYDSFGGYYRLTDLWPNGRDLKQFIVGGTSEFWALEIIGHGPVVCGTA